MSFYEVAEAELSPTEKHFGFSKCIVTCSCGDIDCPALHIQTDESFDGPNIIGLIVSSKPPKCNLFKRIKNAFRMIVGKEILWPDAMYIDRISLIPFREWINKVTDTVEGIDK
ncbi:MAG: hypothetical protein BWY74_02810 [Firmicutes bacterium ADurb.Bin419]|nr:MAG: hypothetical protein BWY74_02810 [Firmicutes bacterium ADurb.Bin419]